MAKVYIGKSTNWQKYELVKVRICKSSRLVKVQLSKKTNLQKLDFAKVSICKSSNLAKVRARVYPRDTVAVRARVRTGVRVRVAVRVTTSTCYLRRRLSRGMGSEGNGSG